MVTKAEKISLLYEAFLVASLVVQSADLSDTNTAFIEAVKAVEKGLTLAAFTAPADTCPTRLAALKAFDLKYLSNPNWEQLFFAACDHFRVWRECLDALDQLKEKDPAENANKDFLVKTFAGILANPYLATKVAIKKDRLEVDDAWFASLYQTIEAAASGDMKETLLMKMGELIGKLEQTSSRWFCSHQFRILLPLSLCPFHEDLLKFDQLLDIFRCYNSLNRRCLNMAIEWHSQCPKSTLLDLVRIAKLMITMKVLELNPENEDGFFELLDGGASVVRHGGKYLTMLFTANERRRVSFHREQLTLEFWREKEKYRDVDGVTLKPLDVPYLPIAEFYDDSINAHPHLLEADFASGYGYGDWPLELVNNACLLNSASKSHLMDLDAKHQQQGRSGMVIGPFILMQKLRIPVRRNEIVQDALNALVEAQASTVHRKLKWPLMVQFEGEEGIDEGGLAKEFFQLLVEKLFNPEYNMFCKVNDEAGENFWFAPNSLESLVQFELIGIVLGLAVYNRVILDVQFPRVLYRKLLCAPGNVTTTSTDGSDALEMSSDSASASTASQLLPTPQTAASPPAAERHRRPGGRPRSEFARANELTDVQVIAEMAARLPHYEPHIDDLDDIFPHIAIGLRNLLKCPDEEVELYNLTFSVTVNNFGDSQDVPLPDLEGGYHDPEAKVTSKNRLRYVKSVLHYYLVDASKKQFEAFYRGFHRCCGGPALLRFQPEELNVVICGVPGDLDFADLRRGTRYADGYTKDSPVIVWFWNVAEQLSQEDKKKLLFFVTGSDRTPVAGLASLQLTIIRAGGEVDRLPTSHTCFNHLLLPEYKSEEQLKRNLLYALEHRHGFGLL